MTNISSVVSSHICVYLTVIYVKHLYLGCSTDNYKSITYSVFLFHLINNLLFHKLLLNLNHFYPTISITYSIYYNYKF